MAEPPEPTSAPFTAAELAGFLAVPERRRTIAALVLGATTVEDVCDRADLDVRSAAEALARLVEAGFVVRDEKGNHWALEEAFGLAARAEAPPESDEHDAAPAETARVLRAFVRDGRLLSIPQSHGKRLVVLDLIAQDFEPGLRYSEERVNLMLERWHEDTAALRRYLVDDDFLDRAGGEYWRTGGSVDT